MATKRPIVIAGRRTGVSVEDGFWESLKKIAKQRHENLQHLLASIDADRQHANLSSAIRLYVLGFYRDQYKQRKAVLDASITQNSSFDDFRPSFTDGSPSNPAKS
jgi:predicted DNA-binding ribbon-helix-helix protein